MTLRAFARAVAVVVRVAVRVAIVAIVALGWPASATRADAPPPSLTCANPSACSESVAWLVRTTAIDTWRCTAFLLASDTLVTARHCAEPSRRDGGRTLDAAFMARFAATEGHPAETHVARIVRMADTSELAIQSANDWAVLKLETHTERAPLFFDRTGVLDAMPVRLYVVDTLDPDHASLRELSCSVVFGSIFAPHIDAPDSPAVTLAGCDVLAGHSGAPVVDAAGHARAIVHARDTRQWPWREPLRWPVALAGAAQDEPMPIAYATSAACVAWGRPDPLPASCALDTWLDRTRHPGVVADLRASHARADAEAALERARVELEASLREPSRARWRVRVISRGVHAEVIARPPCRAGEASVPFEARHIAIAIASTGRSELRVTPESGDARGACPGSQTQAHVNRTSVVTARAR